mgnify:CR=1 FL=1
MTDNRIYLFDTTLRDGQQTRGVDFTPADKIAIARALDEIGIDYVEGGWPGANPTDDRFFAEPPKLERATLVAFGMTRRPGRSAENDPGLAGVLGSKAGAACLVGKTWDFHVDVALEIDRDENVQMIRDSMALAIKRGFEPMFDCEHFFDGYKANRHRERLGQHSGSRARRSAAGAGHDQRPGRALRQCEYRHPDGDPWPEDGL